MKKFLLICFIVFSQNFCFAEFDVNFGKQKVIIPSNNRYGFDFFPDAQPVVISTKPAIYLLTVGMQNGRGIGTAFVMQGPTMEKAVPVRVALQPSGNKGSYEESHTGISGLFVDESNGHVFVFFNAEMPVEVPTPQGGRYRCYASCGVAESKDGGKTFEKLGPYLTGRPVNPDWKGTCQGNAGPNVCVDHTGEWIYSYYHEHSRENPATHETRSVIVCMARSKVSDCGRPGTWQKYYEGQFSQPGLGGFDSEVADCWAPTVKYVPEMKKYIMIGLRDGICMFVSDDGIHWGPRQDILGEECLRVPENSSKPVYCQPTFIVESASATEVKAMLFYAFSANSKDSLHLVQRPVTFFIK